MSRPDLRADGAKAGTFTDVDRQRRATILSVARLAGVSTATVSRVLSGVSPVNQITRQRVEAAIQELNYRPSELTRAVFAGRSNTIGVLFSDLRNPYYVGLVGGISQVANSANALAYIAAGNRDSALERRILSLMDSHRVRGMITTATNDNDDVILSMAQAGAECVFITRDPAIAHPRMHSIRLDDLAAGDLAWQHLSGVGRRRVLIVNQSPQRVTTLERNRGLIDAAHRDGVTLGDDNIFVLPSLEAASVELRRRIDADWAAGRIDAIFAATGIATFRAYEALSATGLRVPEDVAILGLDDFAWAEHLATPLSVIAQPTAQMGSAAAQVILDEPGESQRLRFAPSLIARASTAV